MNAERAQDPDVASRSMCHAAASQAGAGRRLRPGPPATYAWLALMAEVATVTQLVQWRLTGDPHDFLAKVNLHLLTRRGLEPDRRQGLGTFFLPKR